MINIYIKKLEKEDFVNNYKVYKKIENITWKIIKKFNIILKKKIEEDKIVYLIPNIEKEKIYIKVNRKIKKEKNRKVQIILSNEIKEYKKYFKEYKIIEGRKVLNREMDRILEEILQEKLIQLQDVYILTNKYSEEGVCLIRKLAPKVKTLNVISKEIEKYRTLEEIMQEDGSIVSVANNKKKSLKKAKIIINLDLKKEELAKYNINRNALIINVNQEKIVKLNGFEGIIVQDILLKMDKNILENKLFENFRKIELYESMENENKNIKVLKLYGNNGEINEKEVINWQNILTN